MLSQEYETVFERALEGGVGRLAVCSRRLASPLSLRAGPKPIYRLRTVVSCRAVSGWPLSLLGTPPGSVRPPFHERQAAKLPTTPHGPIPSS
jgi:hypothetical protein